MCFSESEVSEEVVMHTISKDTKADRSLHCHKHQKTSKEGEARHTEVPPGSSGLGFCCRCWVLAQLRLRAGVNVKQERTSTGVPGGEEAEEAPWEAGVSCLVQSSRA
jgi:hypothetical protein